MIGESGSADLDVFVKGLPHSSKRWINEYHWQRNQRIEKKLAPISSGCSRWKSLKGKRYLY
jgi:hypothetical protein